jgi:PAS domain S-box-containing protein
MADLRQRARDYLKPRFNAVVWALLSIVVAGLVWIVVMDEFQTYLVSQQRTRLEAQLAGYNNALDTALARRLILLEGLQAFIEGELKSHGSISPDEFQNVAAGLFAAFQGTHAIWLAPNGVLETVYPPGTPGAGTDLLHSDNSQQALDALTTLRTHAVVTSQPYVTNHGLEMDALLAIYYESRFWGLVTATIDLPQVFEEAGLDGMALSNQLALQDGQGQLLYGDIGTLSADPVQVAVNFPGGKWALSAVPLGGWTAPVSVYLLLARLAGFLGVLLVAGLIYQGVGRQTRLELAVRERTRQLDLELDERKRIEQEVRESEEKYRTLVETSGDAILLQATTGRIVDCNSAACGIFGYARQELNALSMADLVPENVARLLPAEITPEMTTGGGFVETVYRRREGRLFPAEVSSQMVSVGGQAFVLSFIRDITLRKQAEEALRESEERYRSLVQTSPDAIALTDLRGHILVCNQRAAELFDFASSHEMVGSSVFDLIAPEDRSRAIETARSLFKTGFYRDVEYTGLTRSGRRFPCENSGSTIYDQAGRASGFIGVVRDISERKEQAREQAAIIVAASALRVAVSLEEISQGILNQLLGLLNSEGAALFVYVPTSREAVCVGGVSRWQAWSEMHLAEGEGITSQVISTGRPFVNNDIRHYPGTARLELNGGLNAVAGAPLISQEHTIGALWVGRDEPFREGELRVLMVIADMVANAVQRAVLNQDLQRTNRELEEAYLLTLEGWAQAMALRDKETGDHVRHTLDLTLKLAKAMGMDSKEMQHVRRGALLHDIGKLGIPDRILLKTGPLSEEDWSVMRLHPVYARNLIEPIPYLRPALAIPYCHHEHWDGSGYPQGLKGEQIPLAARIFCVVDVWEALTSDRVYRPAWAPDEARRFIHQNSGVLFDPQVVEMFFKIGADQKK